MSSYVIQERITGESVADGVLVSGPLPGIGSSLKTWHGDDDVWLWWTVTAVVHELHNTGPDVLAARVVVVVERAP